MADVWSRVRGVGVRAQELVRVLGRNGLVREPGFVAAVHGCDHRRVELWNNPSCSKCAGARETLDEARVPYRLRAYLEQPPTAEELTEVLRRLGAQPWEICRTGEAEAVAAGMADWPRDEASVPRWIAAMVASPRLIQRPILLLDDGTAVVGRTPEALAEAVDRSTDRQRPTDPPR